MHSGSRKARPPSRGAAQPLQAQAARYEEDYSLRDGGRIQDRPDSTAEPQSVGLALLNHICQLLVDTALPSTQCPSHGMDQLIGGQVVLLEEILKRDARKTKQVTDTKVNKRPEQVQKRVEANGARRKAKALGMQITGRDASHQPDGSIRFEESSKNRGRRGEGNR